MLTGLHSVVCLSWQEYSTKWTVDSCRGSAVTGHSAVFALWYRDSQSNFVVVHVFKMKYSKTTWLYFSDFTVCIFGKYPILCTYSVQFFLLIACLALLFHITAQFVLLLIRAFYKMLTHHCTTVVFKTELICKWKLVLLLLFRKH